MFEPHRRCSGLSPDSAIRGHSYWAPWGACLDTGRPPHCPGPTFPKAQMWIPWASRGIDRRAKAAGSLWRMRPRPPILEFPNSTGTSLVDSFLLCLKLLHELAPPMFLSIPLHSGVLPPNPAPQWPSRPSVTPFPGSSPLSLERIQAPPAHLGLWPLSPNLPSPPPPPAHRLGPCGSGSPEARKVPPDAPNAGDPQSDGQRPVACQKRRVVTSCDIRAS